MNVPAWLGVAIALGVNASSSLGVVLQKKGIGWQDKTRPKSVAKRRDFLLWLIGFILLFSVPGLNFLALYGISSETAGALGASSVAFTALFSRLFLGERYRLRAITLSGALLASIAAFVVAGAAQPGPITQAELAGQTNLRPAFIAHWLILVAAVGGAWLASGRLMRLRPVQAGGGFPTSLPLTVFLGAVSGALGGFMLIIIKLFQLELGTDFLSYPSTPYMYAHISVGVLAPWSLQLACRHGPLRASAPAMYGAQVVYPVAVSWLIFSTQPSLPQVAALAAIVACVAGLAAEGNADSAINKGAVS